MISTRIIRAAGEFVTVAGIGGALALILHTGAMLENDVNPRAVVAAVKLAKHDVPTGDPMDTPTITEDDARWNCATMGDHTCGAHIVPTAPDHCFPVTAYRDGRKLSVWLELRATGPTYCTAIPGA